MRAGIEVEDNATDAERREAGAARKARDDLYGVNALAATFFELSLRGGPGTPAHAHAPIAAAELARRGIPLGGAADATLQAFRIGYAPHGWDGLSAYLQQYGVSPVVSEKLGLVVPRSGSGHYDRFRHRLMFPVLDTSGRVIAFSGRSLPEPEGQPALDEKPAKYINSPESPIYTKGEHLFGLYQARQSIRVDGTAVLVEGNFDVVSLHARGIDNAVAPLGTAFTEHQARLLKRFADSVTIAFDGDAAGKKATWASRAPCRSAGIAARAAVMPAKMDPDDIVQKRGVDAMKALIEKAQPIAHRLLDILLRDGEFEGKPVQDQLTRAHMATKLIAESSDDIERAMLLSYAEQLAASLGVQGVGELSAAVALPRSMPKVATPREALTEEMSQAILGALLDFPALLSDAAVQAQLEHLSGDTVLGVMAIGRSASHNLEAAMPETLREYVARRLSRPVFESVEAARRSLLSYARIIANARRSSVMVAA